MKKSQSTPNLLEQIRHQIEMEQKLYKRRKFILKTKFFLLLVLPVVIILLSVKSAQVWLRLQLKQIKAVSETPVVKAVKQQVMKNVYVTPEAAGQSVISEVISQPAGEPLNEETTSD